MASRPFRIAVPDEVLADLRERIARTRWPDEIAHSGWDYGTNLAYLKELLEYWRDGFDWRAQEERLNAFHHFRAGVDGLRLHFLHERGRGTDPLPIVLVHGWPSTFFEMTKLVPLLADPAAHGGDSRDAFDVVVPSLPGFGFSEIPSERGMTKTRMGELLAKRMTEVLGYDRFAARVGGIGSGVVALMAMDYAEHVIGIHVSDVPGRTWGPARAFSPRPSAASSRKNVSGWRRKGPTITSRRPNRKRSPTVSRTLRPGWPHGSWKSSEAGATATATSSADSRKTSC